MRVSLLISAAAFAVIAVSATAQSRIVSAFANADSNHDGKVTHAEFVAARLARFDRMDRNGDGIISRDDFARLIAFRSKAGPMVDAMIAEADANHDGKVTRAEMAAAPTSISDRTDANHDDVIDQAESAAFAAHTRAQF